MHRLLRKLRIAWSVFWGLACLLLIVLWVRSYSLLDDLSLGLSDGPGYKIISSRGEMLACRWESYLGAVTLGWYHAAISAEGWPALSDRGSSRFLCFSFAPPSGNLMLPAMVVLPHWFASGLAGAIALAPWMRRRDIRFSLRALLIATTLVAVVLGLIVWFIR